jgi:hypothetical protein
MILALLALTMAGAAAQERPLPDFDAFAARVKNRLATDEERQSGYMFVERRTEERLDASGRPQVDSVKVFEVYPGLPGEDRYRRLIEEDGKPVPPDTLARQDRERRQKVEAYARKSSSDAERQQNAQRFERQRQRYRAAVDDLFRLYTMHLVGRESVEGHDTIVGTLTPKAGVKPLTDDGAMMVHFKARAWISESDAELVRVNIEAIDDLSFGWGLLARVHKGAVVTYQRRKVDDETWLPAKVTWTGSARVLLMKQLRRQGMSEFSGYRKFGVDTSTTYTGVTAARP